MTAPDEQNQGRPDSWWYRVYLGVIAFTALVIAALWVFSRVYSA